MSDIQQLADVVASIKSPGFGSTLATYLQSRLGCDHVLMLGCRTNKHPIYLYDSITNNRDFLFQRYLTGSYLEDPFYRAAQQHAQAGVLRLADVISEPHALRDYRDHFTCKTAMYDELCLFTRLDSHRWLLLFVGYGDESPARHREAYQELLRLQPLLDALLQQHWGTHSFSLSAGSANKTELQQFLARALVSFGEPVLSKREQEITLLLIQGFDSQEIADMSAISVGTVKNHRKKIYAKLRIASLSELFQLFLTHLLSS